MIRNIIFDIGNVLTDFRWKEFLEDKGFDKEMVKRIAKASIQSSLWDEFDRGELSTEELMAGFIANDPEIEEQLHRAYDNIEGMVTKRDYAIPWLEELKEKGFHVFYLSNFSEKAFEDCADALDFLSHMEGGILSCQDKVIKPDSAIYQLLLDRYGLAPEESVFLDDTLKNVEAAQRMGIHGIHFTTKEAAEEQLRALGVQ